MKKSDIEDMDNQPTNGSQKDNTYLDRDVDSRESISAPSRYVFHSSKPPY